MRSSSASFSGIKSGHKQTSNHLLAICGFADHQLQISLKKLNATSIWLRMQNILSMAHVYKSCSYLCGQKPEKDLPLSRNPHFGWSQTWRCLLLLRLVFLLSVSPSPGVRAKALHLPAKHFPFQDGSDDAVWGLLCRRGCRIIAELCRFPYQPWLLVGRQTPHPCSREKFYLTQDLWQESSCLYEQMETSHCHKNYSKCDVPLPVFGSGFILLTL